MNEQAFRKGILLSSLAFMAVLFLYASPFAIELADPIEISLAGFVNPISSAWASDVIASWFILAFWIFYEAKQYRIKHGWACLCLGLFPGVAVGFCLYLIIRSKQIEIRPAN